MLVSMAIKHRSSHNHEKGVYYREAITLDENGTVALYNSTKR